MIKLFWLIEFLLGLYLFMTGFPLFYFLKKLSVGFWSNYFLYTSVGPLLFFISYKLRPKIQKYIDQNLDKFPNRMWFDTSSIFIYVLIILFSSSYIIIFYNYLRALAIKRSGLDYDDNLKISTELIFSDSEKVKIKLIILSDILLKILLIYMTIKLDITMGRRW